MINELGIFNEKGQNVQKQGPPSTPAGPLSGVRNGPLVLLFLANISVILSRKVLYTMFFSFLARDTAFVLLCWYFGSFGRLHLV